MSEEKKHFSLFVRGGTLITFTVLMGSFVAFKAGLFESAPEVVKVPSPGKAEDKTEQVVPPYIVPDDNRVEQRVLEEEHRRYMMVSSKTLVISSSVSWSDFPFTSGAGGMIGTRGFTREDLMMSSSKSAKVFETLPRSFYTYTGKVYNGEQLKQKNPVFRQGRK